MKSKGQKELSGSERLPNWAKDETHGIESFYAIMSPITKMENENYQKFISNKLKKTTGDIYVTR